MCHTQDTMKRTTRNENITEGFQPICSHAWLSKPPDSFHKMSAPTSSWAFVPAALQSVAYASNKYQIAASCSDPNIVVIEKGGEHPWRFLVYELKIAYFTSLSDHSTYKIPQLFITSPREFYYLCNTLHKWVPGSPWKRQNEGQERVWRAQKPPGCFKFS